MAQSYQIGDHGVLVSDQNVVATLARRGQPARSEADRYPPGFLRGVHALGGTWIGDRIVFRLDLADRVLDLFRTHFGMAADTAGLDPLPAPPQSIRVPVARVVRRSLLPATASEVDKLRASLPSLDHRVEILRQRLAAAERAAAAVRARIDQLDQLDSFGVLQPSDPA